MSDGTLSAYILAVFIWVSLTKLPFDKIKDAQFSNWLVRVWAVASGVAIVALDTHYGTGIGHSATMYDAVTAGLKAGIGAVITYHIGTAAFSGFFDNGSASASSKANTVTGVPVAKLQQLIDSEAQPIAREPGGMVATPMPKEQDTVVSAQPTVLIRNAGPQEDPAKLGSTVDGTAAPEAPIATASGVPTVEPDSVRTITIAKSANTLPGVV